MHADDERLADQLRGLAYPVRLQLLRQLRHPRTVSDLRVSPRRVVVGENATRPAARPTVTAHLEKLVEAGMVRVDESDGARSFVVVPQRLYAVIEEMRTLLGFYSGSGVDVDETVHADGPRGIRRMEGPHLVLVHGVSEGRTFPLQASVSIGRDGGSDVCIDYDPYVSARHAAIHAQDGRFMLEDLPGSRNGTSLNWWPLPKGQHVPIESGDLIGVGRTTLLFLDRAHASASSSPSAMSSALM